MVSSESVANYFLAKSFDQGVPLTPMQLLKLVYIAHGWHRGYFGQNLIDDAVEAWQYGPVIPNLYQHVKGYGRGHINSLIDGFPVIGSDAALPPHMYTLDLLNHVWDNYKDADGIQLSSMTHQPGTPWDEVWSLYGQYNRNAIIPNDVIESHYKAKIHER